MIMLTIVIEKGEKNNKWKALFRGVGNYLVMKYTEMNCWGTGIVISLNICETYLEESGSCLSSPYVTELRTMKRGGPKCNFERSIMILGLYFLLVPLPALKFPPLSVFECTPHAHNNLAAGGSDTRILKGDAYAE